MRVLRSLTLLALVSAIALGVTFYEDHPARAQTVDESEQEAEAAERQADVAAGLVDSAVNRRAEIESELAVSITRISDLSAELSAVSSDLDSLKAQIAHGDAELTGIEADIETHAIDAYMDALVGPGVSFVNSTNVEQAMVTGQVVGDVVTAGAARVNELVVRRDALERLQVDYQLQQERVAALKAEVDAEIEHLAALYDEADAEVGRAVREASAADAAYRDALSAVDAAQAREEERRRQEERAPTTTPPPPEEEEDAPTTTAPPPETPDTTDGGGGAVAAVIGTSHPPSSDGGLSFRPTSRRAGSTRRSLSCNVRVSETPMPTTRTRVRRASISSSHRPGLQRHPTPGSPGPAPSTPRRTSGPPPGWPTAIRSWARASGARGPAGGSWVEP